MDTVSGVHFILVQGHRDGNHDGDKWLGIYDSLITLKERYRQEEFRIYQEKKMLRNEQMYSKKIRKRKRKSRDAGDYNLGEIMVYAFDEISGKWTYDVDLNDPYTEATSARLTQEEINYLLGADQTLTESNEKAMP